MLELFPEGFEERDAGDVVELAAYTDSRGEEQLWAAFGNVEHGAVADDWETRWQQFHRPVIVGDLWVGPPWEEPESDHVAVVIEPGRAFGTGSHPTTQMCLALLQAVPRGSVLDLGCGSGVVAIAAARLGCPHVLAVDRDPLAVEATRRNAVLNGVEVEVRLLDALSAALPQAGTAVANITRAAVEALAPRVTAQRLITSGYLQSDVPQLAGYTVTERRSTGGWAADLWSPRTQ
jgi:ribosomal protein L11 methyltransferase